MKDGSFIISKDMLFKYINDVFTTLKMSASDMPLIGTFIGDDLLPPSYSNTDNTLYIPDRNGYNCYDVFMVAMEIRLAYLYKYGKEKGYDMDTFSRGDFSPIEIDIYAFAYEFIYDTFEIVLCLELDKEVKRKILELWEKKVEGYEDLDFVYSIWGLD